jgi:hypothetical protein
MYFRVLSTIELIDFYRMGAGEGEGREQRGEDQGGSVGDPDFAFRIRIH